MSKNVEYLDDVTSQLKDWSKVSKKKRKQEKKEKKAAKKAKVELDMESMKQQDMEEGIVVPNDDIQYDLDKYTQYKENMTGPINVLDGLLSIDNDGELYFQGMKQQTDASHTVNRHVIKTLMNDISQDMGTEDEQRMVDISGRVSFDTLPLNNIQNRHKNSYVKKIRDIIKGKREFNDEQKYLPFDHNGIELNLKHKTRKPIVRKGVHFQEKEKIMRELDKSKPMDQRVIELEAENAVLRDKRAQVGPQNPTMGNRPEIIPELEPVRSQVLNVDPVTQMAQPGPYQPDYMPLYQSPSLHYIQSLFYNDKLNYGREQDKAIFGNIFGNENNTGIF